MARILVSLNPSRGLEEKINLQYKDYVFEQILDYESLTFRCHRCRVCGHLAMECPFGRRKRLSRRTSSHWEKDISHSHFNQEKEGFGDQNAEGLETEVLREGQPQEEPQYNDLNKDLETDLIKYNEEISGESGVSQNPSVNEKVMDKCLDSPPSPFFLSYPNAYSEPINFPSSSSFHKNGLSKNIAVSSVETSI